MASQQMPSALDLFLDLASALRVCFLPFEGGTLCNDYQRVDGTKKYTRTNVRSCTFIIIKYVPSYKNNKFFVDARIWDRSFDEYTTPTMRVV